MKIGQIFNRKFGNRLMIFWLLVEFCQNFAVEFCIYKISETLISSGNTALPISICVYLSSWLCFRSIFSLFIHHLCLLGFFPLSEKDQHSWINIHQPNFIEQHSWANINEPTLMDYHSRTQIYEPPFIDHNSRTTIQGLPIMDQHSGTTIHRTSVMDHHTRTTNHGPTFLDHHLWTTIHGSPIID